MCSACLFILCLHVRVVSCFAVLSCGAVCSGVCSGVCVLCRDASSALRCMAGEDRTNENAAEGGLLRQRAVRRRTDPSAPVISAWTLRRGNCVCSVCLSVARAQWCMWDLWLLQVQTFRSDVRGFCVLPVEVTACLCCRRRCCCSTSQTPASPIQLGKRRLTSPVNSDALRWVCLTRMHHQTWHRLSSLSSHCKETWLWCSKAKIFTTNFYFYYFVEIKTSFTMMKSSPQDKNKTRNGHTVIAV